MHTPVYPDISSEEMWDGFVMRGAVTAIAFPPLLSALALRSPARRCPDVTTPLKRATTTPVLEWGPPR